MLDLEDDVENDAVSVTSRGTRRSGSRSPSASSTSGRRSRSRSDSGSRASRASSAASRPSSRGGSSSPASRCSSVGERGRSSYPSLVAFVQRQLELQVDDWTGSLDPTAVLAKIKQRYRGVKSLSDGYVPGARVNKANGHHLAGCPCSVCSELESTLSKDEKELARTIQILRNWLPRGRSRPRCLSLPAAVPASGVQGSPYIFTGPSSTLKEMEAAFATGVSLHSALHGGKSANSTSNLSSRWIGGPGGDAPSAAAGSSSGLNDYRIPKVGRGVTFAGKVKEGPRSWKRLLVQEAPQEDVAYSASDEAMDSVSNLFVLPKPTLEKVVKDWVKESCTMPKHQHSVLKLPPLPQKFESVAKVEPSARAREKSLMDVGHAFNYVTMSAVRMSETIMFLDEYIPELEIRMKAVEDSRPPIYLSPVDRPAFEEVKNSLAVGQALFADPPAGSNNDDHWLRVKGEKFLAASSVLKDTFKPAEENDDGEPATVSREDYLEVCWRLATLREYSKVAKSNNEDMARLVGKFSHAFNTLAPELRNLQEVFSSLMYPAVGLTRATLMHQRLEFFKNNLTPDFRAFLKAKAADNPLPSGVEKPFMSFLIDDPSGAIEGFSEKTRNKAKEREVFITKRKKDDPKPGSSKSSRDGGGYNGGSSSASRRAPRSPGKFLKNRDRSSDQGSDRGRSPKRSRRDHDNDDDRSRSPKKDKPRKDNAKKEDKSGSGKPGKGSSGKGKRSDKG